MQNHKLKQTSNNTLTVYVGMSEKRYLPYSLLFDLLIHINNEVLDEKIADVFSNTLPQRKNYVNEIDLWVDLECCGDITYIMASALAKTLAEYLSEQNLRLLHLIINAYDNLSRDNKILIFYLKKYTQQLKIEYRPFEGMSVLFNHEQRYLKWPCFIPVKKFDFNTELENIIFYAWRCAELGAEAIGFKLLELGIKRANSTFFKQLCLVQLQLMRVATQYYEDAATESRIVLEKYPNLQKSYCLAKAWGNILIRRVPTAQRYFAYAGVSMDNLPSDLHSLYRMNIFALYQFLSGQADNAIHIEQRIHRAIVEGKSRQAQITYINSINLARLYRATNNFEQAKKYYDLAFQARGTFSETDQIYYHVCYGLLYEKQKLWEPALIHWLQAGLFWLTAEHPEALGWRAVRGIAMHDFIPRSRLNTAAIDEAIAKKLIYLCAQRGCQIDASHQRTLSFKKNAQSLPDKELLAFDNTRYGLTHSPIKVVYSASSQHLQKLLSGILAHYCQIDLEKANTFTIYLPKGKIDVKNPIAS